MEDNPIEDENIRLSREVKRFAHEKVLLQDEMAALTQKVESLTQLNADLEQVGVKSAHPLTHVLTE